MRTEKTTGVLSMIRRTGAAALATACVLGLGTAAPASAEFGVSFLDTDTHTARAQGGVPASRHWSQAGAHADSTISFRMRTKVDQWGHTIPDGSLREVVTDLPAGFSGDPQAVPQCNPDQFTTWPASCPADTQVGIARTEIPGSGGQGLNIEPTPIYNLIPAKGETAVLAFFVASTPVKMVITPRTDGDFGLQARVANISQAANVYGQQLTLWGVPADPVHDFERYASFGFPGARSTSQPRPFLTLPPTCPGPMTTTFRARAWGSDEWITEHDITDDPETGELSGPDGCDKLAFDARLRMQPGETKAGVPSPYTAHVSAAYDRNPQGLGNAHVKDVTVTLPQGTAISPPNADGLEGCSPEQLKLGSREDAACPAASKIGDVTIVTPLLAEPLTGDVYLRTPTREQLFAIALVARGPGLVIKLPGEIHPDRATGQIVSVFRNNPQLPFTDMWLRFKGGPRAPLSNPQTCGQHTTTTTITSWAGHSQTSTDTFTIDKGPDGGPCRPLGFAPGFTAGMQTPTAGESSTFSLRFGRSDADQDLGAITVQMPPGLTGRLAIADQCADALANAGACPTASRVGSVTAGSGAGTSPFYLPGRVYMTGPYKGAPLGLSIVVPAIAGPFDLGTVVVRAAVHVDRRTAALRVVADPMPTILEGVPLRVRTVDVRIDRQGFMINPTSCTRKDIAALISSASGATAPVGTRFTASNCRTRPVRQTMALAVGARGKTGKDRRTPFTATLRQMPGQSNLRSVSVVLPKTLNGRLDVIQRDRACTIAQFETDRCPTVIGQGVATTPLLRDPLRGPAYFVYNPARRLPDIVVRLRGQVDVDLVGKVTIPRDLTLQTTFDTVPDVPVSTFRLSLNSGENDGPIGVVTNLCTPAGRRGKARITTIGHNGRRQDLSQRLRVDGCGARARARRQARRDAARRRAARRASSAAAQADAAKRGAE